MSKEKNFQLKKGVIIPVAGTSKAYSDANLTDEIAVELLATNPNRKTLFAKLPKNIDTLVEEFKKNASAKNQDADAGKGGAPAAATHVKIGDYDLTSEETRKIFTTAKISSRATTIVSLQKAFDNLSQKAKDEVTKLAKDLVEAKTATPSTTGPEKTLEEVQFDLEKAEQDLEDLKTNSPENVDAIKSAEENIEKFKSQIEELSK